MVSVASKGSHWSWAEPLPRGEFFAGLLLLGCINGFAEKAIQCVNRLGMSDAIWSSFDISAIVWVSSFAGLSLVRQDRKNKVSNRDWVVAVGLLIPVILPVGPLSWFSVTVLSVYLFISSDDPTVRRGAIILFATTVPMLWSRLLFQLFARVILAGDATLVGWVLGTRRVGDIVEFADGSGTLVILPSCSSLANVSLAILCWVTMSEITRHRKSILDVCWCLSACAAVVAVNVTRMSLMGISDEYYELIHGHLGAAIVNVIILIVTLVICSLGVRRDLYAAIFNGGNQVASNQPYRG